MEIMAVKGFYSFSSSSSALTASSGEAKLNAQTINDLPLPVLIRILSYLDLNDKFRLVEASRFMRLKVEAAIKQTHHDLVVSNSYPTAGNRWWISNDLISLQNDIISGFNFLSYHSMFSDCLKRIRFQPDLQIADLVCLQNVFSSQLVQLEINTLVFCSEPTSICLRELKVLYIDHIKNGGAKLTIDSPWLSHVYFGDTAINCIKFVYPISIVHFEFDYDRSTRSVTFERSPDVLQLTSARVIKCHKALEIDEDSLHDLIVFPPMLTELHLYTDRIYSLSYQPDNSVNFESFFLFLLCQHQLRRRRQSDYGLGDLTIFLNGIQINKEEKMIKAHNFFDSLLNLHFRYRELLSVGGSPQIQLIDYQLLTQMTSQSFEYSFYFGRRYPNVCSITLFAPDRSVHPYEFYCFLKNCRGILELNILFASEFDQQLYDELGLLPNLRSSLVVLRLKDKVQFKESRLKSFDFVANFDFLSVFESNQLNRTRVLQLLVLLEMKQSKFPAKFTFQFDFNGKRELIIFKNSPNEYHVQIDDQVDNDRVQFKYFSLLHLLELLSLNDLKMAFSHYLDYEEVLKSVII